MIFFQSNNELNKEDNLLEHVKRTNLQTWASSNLDGERPSRKKFVSATNWKVRRTDLLLESSFHLPRRTSNEASPGRP